MTSVANAKNFVAELNNLNEEYNKSRTELANKFTKEFSKIFEQYLIEFNVPYIVLRGYHSWNDGDTTYHQLYTDCGYEEGPEILANYFPQVDFSNISEDLMETLETIKLQNAMEDLGDLLEAAFDTSWEIVGAIDNNGVFHFYRGDYDEGF
jgi:hypothetical protein